MAKNIIIIDTSSLAYYTKIKKEINFFHYLRSLFSKILVPQEVNAEFVRGLTKEPNREWLAKELLISNNFYSLCKDHDTLSFTILNTIKGIDKGEAEAVAQYQKTHSRFILSDDERFRKNPLLKANHIKTISTLHIIAMIELHKLTNNYNTIVKSFHQVRKFNNLDFKIAYKDVCQDMSYRLTNKELNIKTNLKEILK